jgi:DNA-binding Lrp family transcriptional regulator
MRPAIILVLNLCVLTGPKKDKIKLSVKDLDHIDRLILNALQDRFPLTSRPFSQLAEDLNPKNNLSLTEEEVLKRVRSLKEKKFIRRLGAIFNQNQLGYKSTLCAARVPEDKIEKFAEAVNSSEQVTHNYLRKGDLNIWFTFCYNKPEQLAGFLDKLKNETGISDIFEMPSDKVYKIRAVFNLSQENG